MRFTRKLTLLSLLCLSLHGCDRTDPTQLIPAYIQVQSFSLTTSGAQGTDSHKITDAWIFVNDQLMGVFELPARVPTLLTGQQNVKIFAGIKNNGQSSDRVRYPFYTNFDSTLTLTPDSVITINPAITYQSTATIWEEDFEDGGIAFAKTGVSDTNFVQDNTDPFEGAKSGVVWFDPGDLYFESRTNEPAFDDFPGVGAPVYVELNYRSNVSFNIGLFNNDGSLPSDAQLGVFTFNPKNTWNKTYIKLSDAVSGLPSATTFDLYFSAVNNGEVSAPKIEMDNIKVVY